MNSFDHHQKQAHGRILKFAQLLALAAVVILSASLFLPSEVIALAPTVAVGSPAPDFTLEGSNKQPINLKSYLGKSVVVLFFYPKDNTAVCTKEVCLFRDSFQELTKYGATVLGISSDSVDSHEQFASKHSLPYVLLSDPDGKVRKLYEVKSSMGVFPGRTTFIIDKKGIIRHSFTSQLDAKKHVDEAMEWVQKLNKESG